MPADRAFRLARRGANAVQDKDWFDLAAGGIGSAEGHVRQSRRMRILIVEDDLEICEILAELCAGQGYEYQTAATVPSAAIVWRDWSPDCILLDLKLPGDPGTVFVR